MGEIIALTGKEITVVGLCIAFVAFILYGMLTDKLVRGTRLDALEKQMEKRVEDERIEKEKWQEAHGTLEKAHAETLKQNSVLLENSRLFIPFIQAFGTGATKFLQTPPAAEEDKA